MLYFMFFELLLVSLVTWSSVHCADRLVRRKVLIHQSPVVLFERDVIRKLRSLSVTNCMINAVFVFTPDSGNNSM